MFGGFKWRWGLNFSRCFGCIVESVASPVLSFLLFLFCFVRDFPLYLVSVSCVALFIKRSESLFRGKYCLIKLT
jgi:hypothetical protein